VLNAGSRRTYLHTGVADLRRSMDGLAGMVRSEMGGEPLSGDLFGFANRRRDRVKFLVWDGSGYWVFYKRLERGTFAWPSADSDAAAALSSTDLTLLLDGVEISSVRRRRWYRRAAA
jgi:transposase